MARWIIVLRSISFGELRHQPMPSSVVLVWCDNEVCLLIANDAMSIRGSCIWRGERRLYEIST